MDTTVNTYLVVAMALGFLVSLLLTLDTLRDCLAARRHHLPAHDPRRSLATGLLTFSLGYLVLKAVILYLAVSLIIPDLSYRTVVGRIGLAAAINICDVTVGVFWYLRKKAL